MASVLDRFETIAPVDREEWRTWLQRNHDLAPGVWLCYYKKAAGRVGISYEEAVEEALCFGWIDSKVQRVDGSRYKQVFTPRKKGSMWSRTNKERVERLIAQGRMTPAGMKKVEEAKSDGSWDQLSNIEDLVVPNELTQALRDNHAELGFLALPPATRKQLLWYLASAKRADTKARRTQDIINMASRGWSIEEMLRNRTR